MTDPGIHVTINRAVLCLDINNITRPNGLNIIKD